MTLTTDRNDPGLGVAGPDGQNKAYLILSEGERAKGFVRPLRLSYVHDTCKSKTSMPEAIAATYARMPTFYGRTFCCACGAHFPVSEFFWFGTSERVGS